MLLADWEIKESNIVQPCQSRVHGEGILSYGLSSFGYDVRLSGNGLFIFHNHQETIVDPKKFDKKAGFISNHIDGVYQIPPKTYALGHSLESFEVPDDMLIICVGKSTYARCGLLVGVTPLEPGWKGYVTIELYNCLDMPLKVYANEGILQVLFAKGSKPINRYDGKYQNQPESIVYAK